MSNKILPYDPVLREKAKALRNNSTLGEILLWQQLKNKAMGFQFNRQVPIDHYIVDFFCPDLMLAIEVDGDSHDFEEIEQNDRIRQNKLESLGINFLRIDDRDVKRDIDNVIREIKHRIIEISDSKNIPLPPSKGESAGHIPDATI